MKLENYVPSIETCRRLKGAGLVQKSIYTWMKEQHSENPEWVLTADSPLGDEYYSAYTVGELGTMLSEIPMNLYPHQLSLMSAMGSLAIGEAEFRSKMILFMVENEMMNEDWLSMWVKNIDHEVHGSALGAGFAQKDNKVEPIDAYLEMNKEFGNE